MPESSSANRLRFAPSPTGYLHVGGARTALLNWLYVKKYGGQFLLRIEDTDRERSTDESTRAIFEGMRWLGLAWDEEVVYQGANLERHRADAFALLERGAAYRCFCTPAELDERRKAAEARKEAFKYDRRCDRLPREQVERRAAAGEPHVIRFRIPDQDATTGWDDLVKGRIDFPNKDIEDFVVLRSDGTPIYNMAVVSDDVAMGITLVMRGDDHVSNTPKQILIYRALGAAEPRFAHLPMIHGMDGKKLSKRRGAVAVADYSRQGILPSAMLNFLALLGWSPGGDREVMTVPEMVELFSPDGLQKSAAVFDLKKLEWMNGQHLALSPIEEVERHVKPSLIAAGLTTDEELDRRREWFHQMLELLRVRSRTIDDIVRLAEPYFRETVGYDPDAVSKTWKDASASAEVLNAVRDTLAGIDGWTLEGTEAALRAFAESRGVAPGKIFQPLRLAVTGITVSPGIADVLVLLGRDRTLRRLDDAVAWLRRNGAASDQ